MNIVNTSTEPQSFCCRRHAEIWESMRFTAFNQCSVDNGRSAKEWLKLTAAIMGVAAGTNLDVFKHNIG